MTLSTKNPRAKQRWALLAGVVASLTLLVATLALATLTSSNFELDRNANHDLTSTHLGALQSSATSTDLTIKVCELVTAPTRPFTIQIDAERLTVTAVAATAGSTGGCAFANPADTPLDSRVWTVTRGVGGTTAASHTGSAPRNDVTGINLAGAPTGHDWDQVYADVQANTGCGNIGAAACTWKNRPNSGTASSSNGFTGPTTFTGTSGDTQNISQWTWTNQSVPDADQINNAYAAKYATPDQNIFVGMDRFAVNGSKDIGFWFFHEAVGPLDGGGFSGAHCYAGQTTDNCGAPLHGDLLILTTFSAGGGTTTARAYEWVGNGPGAATSSDGVLNFLASFGDCGAGISSTTKGCATTANSTVPAPWTGFVQEKPTGASANTFYAGGFMEAGLDLTLLGQTGCFASFMGVSRASPSLTAQPKAFIGGGFENCTATTVTTPQTSTGGALDSGTNTISIGGGSVQVKDLATVTGNGSSSLPTGTVKFYICGPATTDALAQCDATVGGPSNGSHFGTDQSLVAGTTNSTATSSLVTLTKVGHYCFRADYGGDNLYPAGSDRSLTECFAVTPVPTTLGTTAGASVLLGQAVTDTASLSGAATQPGTGGLNDGSINPTTPGAPAGGSISFTLLKTDCLTLATGTGTNPQSLTVSGNGSYGPVSFTPDAVGTYHWVASYTPDTSGNTLGTDHNLTCNDPLEDVIVRQLATTTVTHPVDGTGAAVTSVSLNASVFDYAKVTGNSADGTPLGSVNFFICDPTQVTGLAGAEVCASGNGTALTGNPRTATAIALSSPPASEASSSPAVVANQLGVWCFRATYVPSVSAYTGSSDNTHDECFTVTTTSSGTSQQNWLPNDHVVVSTPSGTLAGTLSIQLLSGSCDPAVGTVVYTEPVPNGGAFTATSTGAAYDTTNKTFLVDTTNAGSYFWRIVFSPTSTFATGFTKCETSTVTVNNNP